MNIFKFIGFAKGYCNLPGCKVKMENYEEWKPDEPIFYQFCCAEHKKRFSKLIRDIKKYRKEYKSIKTKYANKKNRADKLQEIQKQRV